MSSVLIKNATIVNEGQQKKADLRIVGELISQISDSIEAQDGEDIIDASGQWLIPGMIDDQVHFREPGLTHKADIHSESRAAVAGGITSFMEMPNTVPNTLTQDLLEEKYQRASEVSLANYSFFMGASNDNLQDVLKTDSKRVCGVKVFMGSSTGNMLVDNRVTLEGLFKECPMLIATHCEDEETIRVNTKIYRQKYGEEVPIRCHPEIRNAEACYKSSSMAVDLATQHNTRLHILHISTAKEIGLFRNDIPLSEKRITAEACAHHLWFTNADYESKGTFIKWNPAVKSSEDREAIREGVRNGKIDVLATDHAPHTLEEKQNSYFKAPSGGPLVQHAIPAYLEMVHQDVFSIEEIVNLSSHRVADCFGLEQRGYIRKGYKADLVLIDKNNPWEVSVENILYKCGWSPFEGQRFQSKVRKTFVNGNLVYDDAVIESSLGQRLLFKGV